MNRKEIKDKLRRSCQGVLRDLLEDVGFSEDERFLFYNRYVLTNPKSVANICFNLPCSTTKYNDLHNIILDKIISYFEHIN